MYQFDTKKHVKIDDTDIKYEVAENDFKIHLEYTHLRNKVRPAVYLYGPFGKIVAFELSNDWIQDKEVSMDIVFNEYLQDDEGNLQKCEKVLLKLWLRDSC